MMLKVNNTTTFHEAHQWISSFCNRTYSGTKDHHGTIGGVNNEDVEHNGYYMIAFNKWVKGKGKGTSTAFLRRWRKQRSWKTMAQSHHLLHPKEAGKKEIKDNKSTISRTMVPTMTSSGYQIGHNTKQNAPHNSLKSHNYLAHHINHNKLLQSQMGMLYDVGAIINLNRQSPPQLKDLGHSH
eukprot:5377734-Amphidinium_carterae.4